MNALPDDVTVMVLANVCLADLVAFQYAIPQVCRKWARLLPAAHALAGGRLAIPDRYTAGKGNEPFREALRLLAASTVHVVLHKPLSLRQTVDYRWLVDVLSKTSSNLKSIDVPGVDKTALWAQRHLICNSHAREVMRAYCSVHEFR